LKNDFTIIGVYYESPLLIILYYLFQKFTIHELPEKTLFIES